MYSKIEMKSYDLIFRKFSLVFIFCLILAGNSLLTYAEKYEVKMPNIPDGWTVSEFKENESSVGKNHRIVTSLKVSPSGQHLLTTGGFDKVVKLWEINNGNLIRTFKGHENQIQSGIFNEKGDLIITGGLDNSVIVWDLNKGNQIHEFKLPNSIISLAISNNGKIVAAGLEDTAGDAPITWETLQLINLESQQILESLNEDNFSIAGIIFTQDDKHLISVAYLRIKKWTLDGKGNYSMISDKYDAISGTIDFTEDAKLMLNQNAIIELPSGSLAAKLPRRGSGISSAAISPDGALAAIYDSRKKKFELWDIAKGKIRQTLPFEGSDRITCLDFGLNGKAIFAGSYEGFIYEIEFE